MSTDQEQKPLVLNFRDQDSEEGITRQTLQEMAAMLGIKETKVIHRALAGMAQRILPRYEADEGQITPDQLDTFQKAAGDVDFQPSKSIFKQ